MKVAIVDYNAGNVKSVVFALERMGIRPIITSKHDEILNSDKVIFPGQGEASSTMKSLKKHGLDKLLPTLKQPLLGICIGMQMMCTHSEEGNTDCLNIFPINVVKFRPSNKIDKVPQMGWNNIGKLKTKLFDRVSEDSFVYFVHSYFVEYHPLYTAAICDYTLPYSAALQKDNFFATQFHPEKSGAIGEQILKNFIAI